MVFPLDGIENVQDRGILGTAHHGHHNVQLFQQVIGHRLCFLKFLTRFQDRFQMEYYVIGNGRILNTLRV